MLYAANIAGLPEFFVFEEPLRALRASFRIAARQEYRRGDGSEQAMASDMSGHEGQIETIEGYRDYLQQVTAIQAEAIKRLTSDPALPPLEMAAVLEDVANLYLDISDGIRALALAPRAN